jgi:DNA-binding MarR family transcriptional regulator
VRVPSVLKRFRDGGEHRARAVRELGLEMPKHRPDVLSEIRSGLAQLEREPNEFDHGYRTAILDLLAAYEAAAGRDAGLEDLLQAIPTRPNWEEILGALASGVKRPGEITSELGLDAAVVSRALTALSELQVVEALPATDGQDRRSRFYRLTLKGEQLVARLGRLEPMAIEPVVRASAMFFAELATRRRVIRDDLEASVRRFVKSRNGQVRRVAASLISIAKEFSLIHEKDNLLLASEMTAQNRLAQELENYIVRNSPSRTLDALRECVPTHCEVLVRCAKLRDSWNQVLVEHFRDYASARTIDPNDIATSDLPNPKREFALVYDNVTLFKTDADNGALKDLQERARFKLCLSSPFAEVPAGWQLMAVEEMY